jgi:hypothetical protein
LEIIIMPLMLRHPAAVKFLPTNLLILLRLLLRKNVINLDVLLAEGEGGEAAAIIITMIVLGGEVTIVATIMIVLLEEDGVIVIIALLVEVQQDVPIEVVVVVVVAIIEVGSTFIPTKKNVRGSMSGGGNAGLVNHSLM